MVQSFRDKAVRLDDLSAASFRGMYPDLPSTRAAELLAAVHPTTQPEEPQCEATV